MKDQIEKALVELNLETEISNIDLFIKYIDQLLYWNKAYNLTALRNKQDILIQHLFDCLAVIPVLKQRWPANTNHVVDIGSGAGLPGIIIAICMPDWRVTCVDAVGKKTAFIKQVKGILNLSNLESVHGRIEQLTNLNADLIISRAFASLLDFVNLSEKHLKNSGSFLAMKGKNPTDEINQLDLNTNWRVVESIKLQVPQLEADRCLLVLEK